MTTEEVGAYILLLCKSWRENPPGSIPTDDTVLARWARLTPDRWSECRTRVLAPFKAGTDNRLHQKRLRDEFRKFTTRRKQQKDASTKAANIRWNKQDTCERIAPALREECLSVPSSSSDPLKEKPKEKAIAAKSAARATRWPVGFCLSEDLRKYAVDHGVEDPVAEWQKFENRHRAKGSRFIEWDRAWYTWVGNYHEFRRGTNGAGSGKQRVADETDQKAIRQLREDAERRRNRGLQ